LLLTKVIPAAAISKVPALVITKTRTGDRKFAPFTVRVVVWFNLTVLGMIELIVGAGATT
jgi:hypothetical protein